MCSCQYKMKVLQQVKHLWITTILLLCCSLKRKNPHHYSSIQFFRHSTRYTLTFIGKNNHLYISSQPKPFRESTDVVMPVHQKLSSNPELLHSVHLPRFYYVRKSKKKKNKPVFSCGFFPSTLSLPDIVMEITICAWHKEAEVRKENLNGKCNS